jgi:hypothetical protein
MANGITYYRGGGLPWMARDLECRTWQQLAPPEREVPAHLQDYTLPMSLVLARHLGATAVDIYGHTGGAGPSLDGRDEVANRTERRWRKEAACLEAITAWTRLDVTIVPPPVGAD